MSFRDFFRPDYMQESYLAIALHFTYEYAPLLSCVLAVSMAVGQVFGRTGSNADIWLFGIVLMILSPVSVLGTFELCHWVHSLRNGHMEASVWFSVVKIVLGYLQPYLASTIEIYIPFMQLIRFLVYYAIILLPRAYLGYQEITRELPEGKWGIWPAVFFHLCEIYTSQRANWII
jgi:hypothetical protein